MTFALSETDRSSLTFLYLVMYLDPGMEYNVLVSAMTSAGEGPPARIGQKTMNTGKVIFGTLHDFSMTSSYIPPLKGMWQYRAKYLEVLLKINI